MSWNLYEWLIRLVINLLKKLDSLFYAQILHKHCFIETRALSTEHFKITNRTFSEQCEHSSKLNLNVFGEKQHEKRHKGLEEWKIFLPLLYCRVNVFHRKQFQCWSGLEHFLRTFPTALLRNIKLVFCCCWEKQDGQSFHTCYKQQKVTQGNEKAFV